MSERHAVFIEMGPKDWDPLGPLGHIMAFLGPLLGP